ncbi:PTS transporter subunit EIIC [Enterococcus faecalis]|uniref:PTS transporter subunit EIIC n=1 Tax=Enterococcus TaxID=1350 RepID=UPI001144795B|nr:MULTISPECIES: PTS transporter subunit EIIC [Enterococcus]NSW12203.1 PTS transporter subunit EIIC [Enterococcus faecalis]NTL54089.1 PTS transporter subunit EIIC [Enterococcus faecium]TQB25149.1 PTS acetylglucosamine transporter subunit IIB [Enterococcus faecalis]
MKKIWAKVSTQLSLLGKTMMVPIAIIPITAIITNLFSASLLNVPAIANAGSLIIVNLDLIFAMAASVAYSKGNDKMYVLFASAISFIVFKSTLTTLNENINMGVFGGIIFGVFVALLYNHSRQLQTPKFLAFFGGEKAVITLSPILAIILAYVFSVLWIYPQIWLGALSEGIASLGILGVFLFLFLQRILVPFGLHHVLNAYFLFELGSYTLASGEVVKGLTPRFLAGDVSAGIYGPGVYIAFFFGIPAIALAIYRTAYPENKEEVKGLMFSGALTSILGGITEPVEFTFMFASPKLYFLHALYTGIAGIVTAALGVSHGGGKTIIHYILLYNLGQRAWLIFPIGIIFGVLYYLTFKWIILKENVQTPGRQQQIEIGDEITQEELEATLNHGNYYYMAKKILQFVGGKENVEGYTNCMTRLRLKVKDMDQIDEASIKKTGALAVVKQSDYDLQIVIGTDVHKVYDDFKLIIEER